MKKLFLFIFLIVILSVSSFSQTKYKFIGSLGTGLSVPASDFGDNFNPGLNINGSGGIMLNNSTGINLALQYNHFPSKSSIIKGYIEGGSLNVTTFYSDFLVGLMNPKEQFNFYGYVGLGLAFVSTSDVEYRNPITGKTEKISGGSAEARLSGEIGVRGIFKINKKLGIFGDMGINFFGQSERDFITESNVFIPLKIGVEFTPL